MGTWLPSSSHAARPKPRPVMNVTPLVDVVLVLLIIFMVVIPAMDQQVQVTNPTMFNVDDKVEEKAKPFILSLTDAGEVYLDEDKIAPAAVAMKLREASRAQPHRKLVLRGDVGVAYGKIRALYRAVQEVGFPGVSLRVNQRKETTAAR